MQRTAYIRFRKERAGPESDLIKSFLSHYKELFNDHEDDAKLEITLLTEPYAEAGVPDILLILWDKNLCKSWQPERDLLTRNDIKILHYISTCGKRGTSISKIIEILNFNNKELTKSLNRLIEADLIEKFDLKVYVKDLNKKFFIKKIISIEAKINNWKNAIFQAQLNENFSSHSYVLLPAEKINDNVLSSFTGRTGLLAQDGGKPVLKKKAERTKIPGSYFSWILNEHLGRQHAQNFTLQ